MTTALRSRIRSMAATGALAYLFVFQLSSLLTFDYWQRIEYQNFESRVDLHSAIVHGEAPYQYRYRILIPYAAEALITAVERVPFLPREFGSIHRYSRRDLGFYIAYFVLNWLALAIALSCIYELVRTWFGMAHGLFGITLAAVIISFTFRDHYFHPWSFWEMALYAAAMLLVQRKAYWSLAPLAVVGALTRETTAFLPLGFLLYSLQKPLSWRGMSKTTRYAAAAMAAWLITYLGVHAAVGYRPATFFLETAFLGNRRRAVYSIVLNLLILGPVWLLALRGVFSAPLLIKRFALAFVPYFLLLLVIGYWWEIRYWLSPLPVLVLAVMFGVENWRARDPGAGLEEADLPRASARD